MNPAAVFMNSSFLAQVSAYTHQHHCPQGGNLTSPSEVNSPSRPLYNLVDRVTPGDALVHGKAAQPIDHDAAHLFTSIRLLSGDVDMQLYSFSCVPKMLPYFVNLTGSYGIRVLVLGDVADPSEDRFGDLLEGFHLFLCRTAHAHVGKVQRAPDVGWKRGLLGQKLGYASGKLQVVLLGVQGGG